MMQLTDFQVLLADFMFGGDVTVAGLVMFAAVIGVLFILIRNVVASLIITLPLIMVASTLGIISGDMMILLIIITVLGLAVTARNVLAG